MTTTAVETAADRSDVDAVFTGLYRRYCVDLCRFIARHVGDPSLAEDLAADVWVKVLRTIGTPAWSDANPWGLLQLAARNRVIDHWRCGFHAREVADDEAVAAADRPDGRETPDAVVAHRAEADAIAAAVQRLPDRQRVGVWLRFFSEMNDAEVGDLLGLHPMAARDRRHRGVAALGRDVELCRALDVVPLEPGRSAPCRQRVRYIRRESTAARAA